MVDISKTIYFLNREQEERHTKEAAQKLNIPYINLTNYPLTKEVLNIVPKESALRFQVIPYLKIGSSVKIGVSDPKDKALNQFLDGLGKKANLTFVKVLISRSSLLYGILAYEKRDRELKEEADKNKETKEESFQEAISDIASTAETAKRVTVTRLLDVILTGATKLRASDVHLEPEKDQFEVRYRVDGVLQSVVKLPIGKYKALLSRIKFLSKMRMDKTKEPQDGRFSINKGGEAIDLRVSVLPSAYGESVVMRLLGQEKAQLKLNQLGFRPEALSVIKTAILRPHGMVLTSGPTGSGKTSTLYAILMELNRPQVKIITLEDPVEYRIPSVEQSQVSKEVNYSFSSGLRAILRQDPDIVMVGEIRDPETAETAVQAAMTGHLMLSTIHANSAPGVFIRFLEIGVKPFLLAGSINLVMAQRLIRKICPTCVKEYLPRPEIIEEIKKTLEPIGKNLEPEIKNILESGSIKLKKGQGCEKCGKTGFKGRQVIVEVLVPNEEIEKLIKQKAALNEFKKAAKAQGMVTMEQDGLIKALLGITAVEEVWRVTKE